MVERRLPAKPYMARNLSDKFSSKGIKICSKFRYNRIASLRFNTPIIK